MSLKTYCLTLVIAFQLSGCVSGWYAEESPVDEDLLAVWGRSETDVFAVGENGTVLHRQDGRWRKLDSGTSSTLRGIWGVDDDLVLVAGEDCTALKLKVDQEENDQADFSVLEVSTCTDFWDLDGRSREEALLVGQGRMQVFRDNQVVNTPNCGGRMLGVSLFDAQEIIVVGDSGTVCHSQGDSWQEYQLSMCLGESVEGQCQGEQMYPILWDVWIGAQNQGAVVGNFGGFWLYPPEQMDNWQPMETKVDSELFGVHGYVEQGEIESRTVIYAVGSYGSVFRYKNGKLVSENSHTNEHLYGVWASEDGDHVYAVGAKGTIVHYVK
jgi:hypothetical protein